MTNDIEMLNSIRKSTEMGIYGIQTVMEETADLSLCRELSSQLEEYEKIYEEADDLLRDRGGKAKNVNAMAKLGSSLSARMQIRMAKDPTAKVAELMLQGNTKGMIKGLKNLHQYNKQDHLVKALSQKLLDCENANIRQMQGFL